MATFDGPTPGEPGNGDGTAAGPGPVPTQDAQSLVPGLPDTAETAATAPDSTPSPSAEEAARARSKRRRTVALLGVVATLVVALVLVSVWELRTGKPLSTMPGINQARKPHFAFSIYGTTKPIGVAVTRTGDRIYVTESDGQRVVKVYDRAGKSVGTLQPPKTTGAAHVPMYVAIDPTNGEVYVSDRFTATVYVYAKDGKYLRAFDPKGDLGAGWAPLGVAFDAKGRLYVTDVRVEPHRVLVFDTDGKLQRAMGVDDKLSFPNDLVVDSRGAVTVSDSNNGRIVVYNGQGKQVAAVGRGVGGGDLGLPRGTAVDDAGRLYVVDTSNHLVRMYKEGTAKSPLPQYLDSFGDEGTVDGKFEYPNGIATDNRARIYITDRENNRVQVWTF